LLSTFGPLITALVALAAAAALFAWWVAGRKRIATETIGRAEEQARRIAKDAERDAETRKKEALLDAKEKAHEILMEAERQARQDRQQAAAPEREAAVEGGLESRRGRRRQDRLAGAHDPCAA